mgnify:CR=1 FL=1
MGEAGAFDKVVDAVKRSYCDLRKRAQCVDHFWPTNEKWDKYWKGAAMMCVTHRIPPREFVEVQFHVLRPWPDIQVIASDKALDRFFKHRKEYAESKAAELMVQLEIFDRMVSVGYSPRDILEGQRGFDPLFIYVFANVHELEDVAEQVEDRALLQYAGSVYYDKVYPGLIPQKLKDRYESLLTGVEESKC